MCRAPWPRASSSRTSSSSWPTTSATRFALITGRYQYRLRGGLEEPIHGASDTIGSPRTHPTLPSLLRKNGYGTALIGKWHLGSLPNFGPIKSGYDSFFGNYGGAIDYFTHKPGVGPNVKEDLYEDEVPVQQIGYYTDLLGARAVDFVNCLLYTSPSPRDRTRSRMPSSA